MSDLPLDQGPAEDETSVDGAIEERIAAILSDPSMPATEKRAHLDDLIDSLGIDPKDGENNAPLEAQILHALSLLAEGGHDYSRAGTDDADGDVPAA